MSTPFARPNIRAIVGILNRLWAHGFALSSSTVRHDPPASPPPDVGETGSDRRRHCAIPAAASNAAVPTSSVAPMQDGRPRSPSTHVTVHPRLINAARFSSPSVGPGEAGPKINTTLVAPSAAATVPRILEDSPTVSAKRSLESNMAAAVAQPIPSAVRMQLALSRRIVTYPPKLFQYGAFVREPLPCCLSGHTQCEGNASLAAPVGSCTLNSLSKAGCIGCHRVCCFSDGAKVFGVVDSRRARVEGGK